MSTPEYMTLGERLRRHLGLIMSKRLTGHSPDPDQPGWEGREWMITFRFADPEVGIRADIPAFVVRFGTGTGWAQDGTDITMGTVLNGVLRNIAVARECPTYESYCEEFQPGKIDSRAAEASWRAGRDEIGRAAEFLRDMEERGGDPPGAWLYETDRHKYNDAGELPCLFCGTVFLDEGLFSEHRDKPHSSGGAR